MNVAQRVESRLLHTTMKSIVFLCLVVLPWTTQADSGVLASSLQNRTARLLRQSSNSLPTINHSSSNHGGRNQTVRIHPLRRAARLAAALLEPPIAESPNLGHERDALEPADSQNQHPAATSPLDEIDNFALYYWGTVIAIGVLVSLTLFARFGIFAGVSECQGSSDRYSLYENIWALVLVSCVGKASIISHSKEKWRIPVWVISLIVAVLFTLQISAVILIVGSIDPNAEPVTKKPASPWLQHRTGHTVNAMKVIMTIFLGASQIGEISQCRRLALVSWNVRSDNLLVPRFVPMMSALMQYAVALSVVWSGVVVILSFATCLDIVYSSMSVVFITSGDEMFFDMFEEVCDVESNFDVLESSTPVHHRRVNASMPHEQPVERLVPALPALAQDGHDSDYTQTETETEAALDSARTGGTGRSSSQGLSRRRTQALGANLEEVDWEEPMWLWTLLKALTIFPLFWAFGILGRAMYTGIMPLHRLQHTLSGLGIA